MVEIIDFDKKKEEIEHRNEIKATCKDLLDKVENINREEDISDYYDHYIGDLIEELIVQKNLNQFNDDFLYLVHLFMEEECPDFGWRFEVFLNKIRDA